MLRDMCLTNISITIRMQHKTNVKLNKVGFPSKLVAL